MKLDIKILSSNEIDQAIDCFARAIDRDWPNTREEAAGWVNDEFHNFNSIIFGAVFENKIIGTCSLIPLNFVFNKLQNDEREKVENGLKRIGVNFQKAIYIGGLAVEKKYEGRGVATDLFTFVENYAINNGWEFLIGYTARPSVKYNTIKALPIVLSRFHVKELPMPRKIFHLSPVDLEKVWFYKLLK